MDMKWSARRAGGMMIAAVLAVAPLSAHADGWRGRHPPDRYYRQPVRRDYRRDYRGGDRGGAAIGGALLGLGVVALIGGALAQPGYASPPPVYYAPPPPVAYAPPPGAYYPYR